ncbi:MAG: prepilin peptidase [Alphaproteobacteria bacterium]|nr:prepilin peptidase [Alphaproteobacteria bacterium]
MTPDLTLQLVLLAAFGGLAVTATVTDVRSFRIPNRISIAMVALYAAYALGGFADPRSGLLAGGIVFAAGVFMFARGWMGGGDVKLLAAVSLWAGTEHVLPMLLIVTATGGVMSAAEWIRIGGFSRFLLRFHPAMSGSLPVSQVRDQAVVPYAAAILAGALYVGVSHLLTLA